MNVQRELRAAAAGRTYAGTWHPAFSDFTRTGREEDAQAAWEVRDEAASDAEPARLLSRIWPISGGFHSGFRAGLLEPGCARRVVESGAYQDARAEADGRSRACSRGPG